MNILSVLTLKIKYLFILYMVEKKKPKAKKPRKSRVGQKQKQIQIVTVNVPTPAVAEKPKRKTRAKPKPKTTSPTDTFGSFPSFSGAGSLASGQPLRQIIYAPSQDVDHSIKSLERSIAVLSQSGGSQAGGSEAGGNSNRGGRPPIAAVGNAGEPSLKGGGSERDDDETKTEIGDKDDYQRDSLSGSEFILNKAGFRPTTKPGYSNLSPIAEERDREPRLTRRSSTLSGLPLDQRLKQGAGKQLEEEAVFTGETVTIRRPKTQTQTKSQIDAMLSRDAALYAESQKRASELGEQGGGAEDMTFA